MKIISIDSGFALYKEKDEIGRCARTPTPKGGTFGAFCILPQWRRKGYGSYLLKEALRALGGYDREQATVFTAPLPTDPGEAAFCSGPAGGGVTPPLPESCRGAVYSGLVVSASP